jgi:threonine dehydrogenase-like Zn-dependent dehydrogenase
MGAGRVIVIGGAEEPRLALCRRFGAEATVCIDELEAPVERVEAVRELVGGFGADLVVDCAGHPSAGPEGIEMLRDGGTYVEMGQFTDAGAVATNWHRICTKDIRIIGSWAFTADDIPKGIALLDRARARYPWYEMQTLFPFGEEGIADAIAAAEAMRAVKSTILPSPELVEEDGA